MAKTVSTFVESGDESVQPIPQGDRSEKQTRLQASRSHKRKTKKSINPTKLLGPLPLSETGQRLANLFPNGWDWIYADAPSRGSEIDWETIKKYPLAPVELWSLHQNDNCIIGIRPDKETRWGIIDIDRTSQYHPAQNPNALQIILDALEDIGITRTLINQSSHSGGLHIYIPLLEAIGSYGFAVALKLHLSAAGIQIRSGQCEIFPNPKRYIAQGFSLYNGVRLPFQPGTGFIPLDQDLNPLPWTLENWLDAFDLAATHQDIPLLRNTIADAKLNYRIRRGDRTPQSLESWQERINEEKLGWSGPGETNEKLKAIACEARVFMGMDSVDQIAQYIEQTAQSTPGFQENSNHQKDLKQRSKDVASWAMKYYWPMGGPASRETGYHGQQKAIADFSYHQAKREAAQYRIKDAIAQLQQQNALPATATARAKAIVSIAKVSQHTLYKAINKPLWHPAELPAIAPVKIAETDLEQDITQLEPKNEIQEGFKSPQPLINKRITQLLFKVGFVVNSIWREALEALALKGQSASKKAIATSGISERGEPEGGEALISRWIELRASLPIALQEKIAQADRDRRRQDELAKRRRKKAVRNQELRLVKFEPVDFNQLELEISQQFAVYRVKESRTSGVGLSLPEPITEKESKAIREQALDERSQVGQGEGRSPFELEEQDFEQWYALAESFGVVEDWYWDGFQYWVGRGEQFWPFVEMLGDFPVGFLKKNG